MQDVDDIFRAFVSNANAMANEPRTARTPMRPMPEDQGSSGNDADGFEEVPTAPQVTPSRPPDPAGVSEAAGSWIDAVERGAVPASLEPSESGASSSFAEDVPTVRQALPRSPSEAGETEDLPTAEVVLLTRRKGESEAPANDGEQSALPDTAQGKVLRMPGAHTRRAEVSQVVPDVARVTPVPPPVPERSVDGLAPAGELDRTIADMGVLLRYGHMGEVAERLGQLLRRYPDDLLLLRRVVEFDLQNGLEAEAMECLFTLAGRLFERHNFEGMRRALEQVLVLDPENRRAYKLLGLLDKRPVTGAGT